ncbi:MAG: hypothetical protein HYZ81_23715 [Nitrospinae bacterium]|nr:hypothetical protein [Nitrospinota bacterium]
MNQPRPCILTLNFLVSLTAAAILLGPAGASGATPQGKVVVEVGPPAVTICLGDTRSYGAIT